MRRMSRPPESEPESLKDPTLRRYTELKGPEKNAIREKLLSLQGDCCAYCERVVGREKDDGHIEHLWRQKDYPSFEVKWFNLFWSCVDPKTCGKAKDARLDTIKDEAKRRVTNERVLAPDRDNVDQFLQFAEDGWVRPRPSDSDPDAVRAATTLELFNLNYPSLVTARRNAVKPIASALAMLQTLDAAMMVEFAQRQRDELAHTTHASPIRQFLDAVIGSP